MVFITGLSIYGQDDLPILVQVSEHRFSLDDHIGKLHEFEYYFSKDPVAHELFLNFDNKRRKQKVTNIVSLSLIGTGGLLVMSADTGDWFTRGELFLIGAFVGAFAATPVAIIGNATSGTSKKQARNKLLSEYGDPMSLHQRSSSYWYVGTTQHGIGVVYLF